jgi:hypothetical protein
MKPLALAAAFLALGSFFLDLPGIQSDEALFASVLYHPKGPPPVTVRVIFGSFPAMCYPYIGTLKTHLFSLYSRLLSPSPASVHFFALLLGALSIFLFAHLLQRLHQPLWAALLLATDATYLFTIRSDWGPVALQHLTAIAAVSAALRYAESRKLIWIAAAGFLLGLGLWDKITFLWILIALAAGLLVSAPRLIAPKPAAVLLLAFALGAYPFLVYNVKTNGNSFRNKGSIDTGPVWRKAHLVWQCLGNYNLFQAKNPAPAPTLPLQPWLLLAALAALPWYWKYPVYRFSAAAMLAGYAAMFALADSGSGPHHAVLLWPLPHLLIAALPRRRWLLSAAVLANLLQINNFYTQLNLRDVSVEWSDASTRLAHYLSTRPGTYRVLDWGIYDTLHLLTQGKSDLYYGPGPAFRYITHVPELAIFPQNTPLIPEQTIPDSTGRPIFIIARPASVERK